MKRTAVLAFIAVSLIQAQTYTHLSGVISDASGASAPGATVSVVNENSGFRRMTLSETDGRYVVSSLQPGVYKITVRKDGFRTVIRFGVKLSRSAPARVDFKLVVGSVQETVTVEGSTPLLNDEDAAVGVLAGRREIEGLPLGGRGTLGLLELAPGVVLTAATRGEAGQFTASGQRPNANYFTVDGVSANSGVSGGGQPAQATGGALPGMTAFGSFDSLLSREAMEQARVQTSTTVPEFGRLPGAQTSLVSRSGANEWHGSLFYGLRNEKLDANDWFANQHGDPRAALKLNDFAASLGGPLARNRTFFFLSYEGMRLAQPMIWRQPTPSLEARQTAPEWARQMVNLFPSPNGADLGAGLTEWIGRSSRPSRLNVGSARLDQAITSRLTAFGRYSEAPSFTAFGSGPVNLLDLRSRSLTTGLNLRLRSNLVFDVRANGSSTDADSRWQPGATAEPACYQFPGFSGPCDYLARLSIAGVGQVASGSEGRRSQTQYEFNQVTGIESGSHSVRLGADYVRLAPERRDATGSVSVVADSLADLAGSNYWSSHGLLQRASAVLRELSFFAEDTWRITTRLTATYGARWEFTPPPETSAAANFIDPVTGFTSPSTRPIWKSRNGNLAPRLGLAWRLTKDGKTVLRGGGGVYLDSSLSLATDLVNGGPLNVAQYSSGRNGIFSTVLRFGFPEDLRLPQVRQWNVSLERALSAHDVISIGYVGSTGRRLIRREIGGPGSVPTDWLALATNHGAADYNGLQAQYRRRLSRGVEAIASYGWSHSIDNSSTDSGIYWAGSGLTADRDRGSSDFDVRHSLTAGFSYETPVRGWTLDGMVHARSGFPISVLDAEQYAGLSFENVFRPDVAPGQPNWIADAGAPGGRRINRAAFRASGAGAQGNLGRNALTGFGTSQIDLALRREFFAGERKSIQLRIEAFNALNHPSFADPAPYLSSPLFGQSASMLNLMLGTGSPGSGLAPIFQSGGARSLEVVVRFRF